MHRNELGEEMLAMLVMLVMLAAAAREGQRLGRRRVRGLWHGERGM